GGHRGSSRPAVAVGRARRCAGSGKRRCHMPHRGRGRRAGAGSAQGHGRSLRRQGRPCVGRQRVPAGGRPCNLERPRRTGRIWHGGLRRDAAGGCADRECGHDRARKRGARTFSIGPQAGHRAPERGRRVAERGRRGGSDPVRDPPEARGMSDPSALTSEALAAISKTHTEAELEAVNLEYLGRKSGRIGRLLSGIGSLSPPERAALGQAANDAKRAIQGALGARRAAIEGARLADIAETESINITFPGPPLGRGSIHILTQVRRQIETVLESLGYQVELGPEVETEWYNFEALNISAGHPARENWDSFYFSPDLLLRAHTSPVQIRAMQRIKQPPIYIITPGRCYRRDAPEATRLPYFSQVEGLAVDRGLTVGDMKGTLLFMIQSLYGKERRVRVRPSYFP